MYLQTSQLPGGHGEGRLAAGGTSRAPRHGHPAAPTLGWLCLQGGLAGQHDQAAVGGAWRPEGWARRGKLEPGRGRELHGQHLSPKGGGRESHVMLEGAQVCGGGDSVEEAERED